jgi:Tfp pilus assembly protein PilO
MKWSELQPQVRAAIAVAVVVLAVVLIWSWFVSPMRARLASAQTNLTQAESQLETIEREVESVPPPSDAERQAWQESQDEMVSRLGPESELPLLLESLTRLSEAQGVELFITSESSQTLAGGSNAGAQPTLAQRVLASIPDARTVGLECQMYGEYNAIGRFVSQVGRLGWMVEIADLAIERDFPEVSASTRLVVFFRSDAPSTPAAGDGQRPAPVQRGARGGSANG